LSIRSRSFSGAARLRRKAADYCSYGVAGGIVDHAAENSEQAMLEPRCPSRIALREKLNYLE
jgi:hypothetical protein